VTGGSIDQQCRTDFRLPKYAHDSLNLTTWVESGFLVGVLSGVLRGEALALAVAVGEKVRSRGCGGGDSGEHGLELVGGEVGLCVGKLGFRSGWFAQDA